MATIANFYQREPVGAGFELGGSIRKNGKPDYEFFRGAGLPFTKSTTNESGAGTTATTDEASLGTTYTANNDT